MKKNRVKILLALLVFIFVIGAPVAVYASQTSRTLRPGNVYEFTGTDARVISHVSIAGTGRYDIVSWDSRGEITRFGTGSGRFSVSGTGGAAITPAAPITVTFDSSRLSLSSSVGSALHRQSIPVGQTVSFTNNHSANIHIRTTQLSNFDYVMFNRAGNSTGFEREVRLPQISIPVGGSVYVTAALRETVVYFPSRIIENIITESAPRPAIYTVQLLAGQVYTLTNSGDTTHTMQIEPPFAGTTFAFEYITRGRDGHVTSHGERDANQIQLGARNSITITPIMDGELFFPSAWLENLHVDYGTISPMYQTLQSGHSLTITNNDEHRSHSVFINSPDEEYGFRIDYVTLLDDEVTVNTREFFPGDRMTLTLQAGAQTTITILESVGHLEISFPDINEITYVPIMQGALVRRVLEPGQSVSVSYSGEDYVRILTVSDKTNSEAVLDYVRYYENEIDSFGTFVVGIQIVFAEGQSTLITNSSDEYITFRIPQIYLDNGLEFEETEDKALFRLVVESPVQIENRDRHYNHSFAVQNETGRNLRGGRALEFITFAAGTGNNIVDFGERGLGEIELPPQQRMVVAPVPDGISPSIIFPAEWYGVYLRTSAALETPLHRITLRPGRRLTVTNNTRHSFVLHNNSETTAAGYFITTLPPSPLHRGSVNEPAQGPIDIFANTEIRITATTGADLELWMPTRWARQLRFTVR